MYANMLSGVLGRPRVISGGSTLKTGLIDWWENANQTGAHAGLAITNMTVRSSIIAGPDGLDAWRINSGASSKAGNQNLTSDFTYAFVIAEISLNFRLLISGNYSLECWNTGAILMRNYGGSNLFTATRTVTNWASVVLTKSGSSAVVYLNGTAFATTGWTDAATEDPNIMGSAGIDAAKFARASRAWTAGEVTEFHNSGTFKKYSDL